MTFIERLAQLLEQESVDNITTVRSAKHMSDGTTPNVFIVGEEETMLATMIELQQAKKLTNINLKFR
jgi:predicted ATP-grasp superfamily ATP-dependent carboligase